MSDLPEIPTEDDDFTPELARKIIALYQNEIERLREDYLVLKEIFGDTSQFKAFEFAKGKLCGEPLPEEPG